MVFRKPYAFLIKNFKLIHIILTFLMGLFFYKLRNMTDFLNSYVAEGVYGRVSGVVSEYIGVLGILLPILIIAISILIAYILKMKDKPITYYIINVIAYIVEIIIVIVAWVVLSSIQQGTATVTVVSIFTDLMAVLSYTPIPFLVVALVRGVGFNIKQFNFKKDLIELNINEEDSEEFELEVEVDTEDIRAKLNRRLRFIKYTYLENKLVFHIVAILIVVGIIAGIFTYINSQEKIYTEGHRFNAYESTVTLNNSYKTTKGTNGVVVRKDKFYIIVDLTVKNNSDQEAIIPYSYIYLRVSDEKKYAPTDKYTEEFSDFGLRYVSGDKLKANEERQVILVYEIENEYIDNNFRFEYLLSKISTSSDSASYQYTKIDLNVKEFNEVETIETKKIGEELSFKNSLIDGTKIKIDEVEFNNRYTYKYNQVIGSQVKEFSKTIVPTDTSSYKKVIMRIKADITKNDNLNPKIYTSLYEKFATIEYEIDGKTYTQKPLIIDLTTDANEYTYLEVIKDAASAEKLSLVFTIRDKEYRYILIEPQEEPVEEQK